MNTKNMGTTTYHALDEDYDENYLARAIIECRCDNRREDAKCAYCEPAEINEYFKTKIDKQGAFFSDEGKIIELLKQVGIPMEIDELRNHQINPSQIESTSPDTNKKEVVKPRSNRIENVKVKKDQTKKSKKNLLKEKDISPEKMEKHDSIIFFIRMFQVIGLKALSECCDFSYNQTSDLTVELEKLGFIKKFEKVKIQLMRLTKKGVERANTLIHCNEHAYGAHPSKISARKLPEILDHGFLYRKVINDKVPNEYKKSVKLIGTSYTGRRLAGKIQPDLAISYFDGQNSEEVFIAVELEASGKKTSELELKMWHLEKSGFDVVVFYATTKHLQKKISTLIREGVRGWKRNLLESYQEDRRTPCLKTDPVVRMFASVADK